MNIPLARQSVIAAAGLMAAVMASPANATDAQSYILSKGQHFIQTNATPVLRTADKPFEFYSAVQPDHRGSVTNAGIQLPSLVTRGMTNLLDVFEFERSFATREQLDASFPSGRYTFIIDTLSEGRQQPTLNLPASAIYPPVPRVLNFPDLQAVEADQELNVSWVPFTDGTTNDYVLLEISEAGNEDNIYFSSPPLLNPDVLNGTVTGVAIPADTLSYDESYTGRLLFVKRSMVNTNGYPGAVGISGYFRDTTFPLAALTSPPEAGRLQFSASGYRISETNDLAIVTVTRSGSAGEVSVNLSTANGSASDGQDYIGQNAVLTFLDGVTSTNVALDLLDDAQLEGNETVQLSLSSPTGGAILGPRSNAVVAILDNENAAAGTLQFSAARYSSPEEGAMATVIVNRIGGSSGVVTANFSTTGGTAVAENDFFMTNGVVRFGPGITSKTITIRLRDDRLDEPNESFSISLSETTGGAALGATAAATVSIVDNDVAGTLSFSTTVFKTREDAGTALITVTRSGGAAGGVTVDYTTISDSAVAGSDYVTTSGTLLFGADQTSKTFPVTISQDSQVEANERFFVRLSNPTGRGTLGATTNSSVALADDESSLSFAKAAYVFSETNVSLVIPVTRSGALNTPVSISYATANGTALAGTDYRATNGVLNFPTNVTSRNIVIPVIRDHVIESNETLSVSLFNPQGGVFAGVITNASITITNDDFAGRFVFSSASFSANEGSAASIVIKRNGGTSVGTSVTLKTITGGSATAGTDYTAVTTNITFAGGEVSKTIRISTTPDGTPEGNETVQLRLMNPTGGATLGSVSNAVLTINNFADPNAIPAAGPTYMNVTFTGLNGNPVNKTLNVVYNPVGGESVSAGYNNTGKAVQGLTGSQNTFVLSGYTVVTTYNVLQFPFFNVPGPGVYPIDPEESTGGAIWTYTHSAGENHSYGTGRAGSSGNVIFDVVDPVSRILAGRFDFVAVQDGGSAKVRITGSFRVTNVSVF